jgi:dTDP-glucose pyrophosphorylase
LFNIDHIIGKNKSVQDAMQMIDALASDGVLFVIDEEEKLFGSVTDGDIRRGFLRGLTLESKIEAFCEQSPKYLSKGEFSIEEVIQFRERNFKIIPVVDNQRRIIDLINFRIVKSYLPIDVVIMAGGRGQRLSPLTDTIPKPLLKVGDKPIIEHNIDRLTSFGIKELWITVKYLGEQIVAYFGTGQQKGVNINYVREDEPLGTIGAVSKIKNFPNKYVLVTNSDLLTNIDYEDFFCTLLDTNADICIATIPYSVNIPYAIFETEGTTILNLKEKPNYIYFANAGIYLLKRELLDLIPDNLFFNATDLVEKCIEKGLKVHSYPIRGYWLDIGKMDDFKKAQEDINHIKI